MRDPEDELGCSIDDQVTVDQAATVVPRRCTIAGFTEEVSRSGGLNLSELGPLACLLVRTRNTLYRIVVIRPPEPEILVQGGFFFTERTEARLCGCSYGGSLLKLAWIGFDMSMEIHHGGRRIVTSPVSAIEIQREPTTIRPV